MLHSLIQSNGESSLVIHLLHRGDLPEDSIAKLRSLVRESADNSGSPEPSAELTAHVIAPDERLARGTGGRLPIAAWNRIALPDLLMVDRVIYLDSDILVRGSLEQLWSTDLRGNCLGAVSATPAHVTNKDLLCARLGIDPSHGYFNSGVMVMDLEALGRDRVADRIRTFVSSTKLHLLAADQDALNVLIAGKWQRLHPRWNLQPGISGPLGAQLFEPEVIAEAVADPAVVHFLGGGSFKPWHVLCQHPHADEFRASLAAAGFDREPVSLRNRLIARLPKRWWNPTYLTIERAKARMGLRSELDVPPRPRGTPWEGSSAAGSPVP